MRAVVQRAMKASVTVGDELISSIGKGVCVLIGVSRHDTKKDMEYIVRKILNLRIFEDDEGKKWSKNVMDKNYEVLCVSQFTLYAVLKGNKPDYHMSMGADQSQAFYNDFLEEMKKAYKPDMIKDGQFGAYMQVSIQNDGPVTIEIESPVQENKDSERDIAKQIRQQKCEPKPTGNKSKSKEPTQGASTSDADLAQQTEDKLSTS